ncbi:DUF2884 family protein [Candidatus Colwellia aromaticivorans]|uniref:DUF2884 family protein n=1 Tax=Candidatus Colwellia aromaticivorans TaxID=2267621 RepID=UPI000DF24A5A|nr:DUF2884 family protein [Candidatus Colwellia aromaticivorans]
MHNPFILNNKTVKLLPAVAVLSIFSSENLYAKDTCNIKLDAGLTLTVTTLEFFNVTKGAANKKKTLYKIRNDQSLIIHGKEVNLTDQQQKLVTQYATSIREIVPQIRSVAIEGVDLALEGVNLAFNDLLGEGNTVGAELTKELSVLRDEVATRFTPEHGITIGGNGVDNKDITGEQILGKQFEQRIESAVEKAVINSMGSLLVVMGQEMLLSGKQGSSLETRMKAFGENIATETKIRTETIERKADALCVPIVNIDQLEEQLKSSVSPLANINVISARLNKK